MSTKVNSVFLCLFLAAFSIAVQATDPPFTLIPNLFNQSSQEDLGLSFAEGTETYSIFQPVDTTDQFSNGVVMIAFKDTLYCMWQSSAKDEDASDTWVAYSRSADGITWTEPLVLAATIPDGYHSSGGWWATGDTLVGYVNVWPASVSPRGGFTYCKTSTDGLNWSELKPVKMSNGDALNGIFEQDPHALPDGRIINAAHFQPGLHICPIYTDDPTGIRGWTRARYTNMPGGGDLSREIEPSWFLRSDDTLVMTFRDQDGTFKRLASVSGDRGESWSTAILTQMPDSRSKQSAGNLADSTAFMVGNPVNNKTRIPLAITLSQNGRFFNTAYLLRTGGENLQALRYDGKAKRLGYAYPKSMIYNDYLYVAYATNKEDVQYTRVPLASLVLDTTTMNPPAPPDALPAFTEKKNINILFDGNGIIRISLHDYTCTGIINIYNLNGLLVYSSKLNHKEHSYDMAPHPAGTYFIDVRTDQGRKTRLVRSW